MARGVTTITFAFWARAIGSGDAKNAAIAAVSPTRPIRLPQMVMRLDSTYSLGTLARLGAVANRTRPCDDIWYDSPGRFPRATGYMLYVGPPFGKFETSG